MTLFEKLKQMTVVVSSKDGLIGSSLACGPRDQIPKPKQGRSVKKKFLKKYFFLKKIGDWQPCLKVPVYFFEISSHLKHSKIYFYSFMVEEVCKVG